METNEKRIGKIESFFDWIWDFTVFKGVTCILAVILTFAGICIELRDSVSTLFTYPAEEFEYLSTEAQKVIVDNSIDMDQISSNDFETSVTYKKKIGQTEWSRCEIKLTREVTVDATVTKDENGTLSMDVTYDNKIIHISNKIVAMLFIIGLLFIISCVISAIFTAILFLIVCILKNIEKVVLKRRS